VWQPPPAVSWWRVATLAVASRNAKFATPGVDIGQFCSAPMVALSRNVARKHAMEMLLTGTPRQPTMLATDMISFMLESVV
jgi:hypothetical protein